MKLLIVTQKVDINDPVLGFFHSWLKEFSKHVEKIIVICLEKGEYNLPNNVKVVCLGKEKKSQFPIFNSQFPNRIKYIARFFSIIWKERKNYNTVFVHMNSEYIVLAGWFWKLWRKKISLWYVHRAIPWQLRIAEKFVQNIFTASKESCNLKSNKIKIIGHGIDTYLFNSDNLNSEHSDKFGRSTTKQKDHLDYIIISVGRISPIKNQELLINAIDILSRRVEVLPRLCVQIIGAPHQPSDMEYMNRLIELVKEKGLDNVIEFVGAVSNKNIAKYYQAADLSVNLCPTGGVDKAVLESMACGLPVLVFNQTFRNIIPEAEKYILSIDNAKELAQGIRNIYSLDEQEKTRISKIFRQKIKNKFSLDMLIGKIVKELKT